MKLNEIEMDLPYQKNEEFIQNIQETKKISYEETKKIDYELNWKNMRRKFQLMTRCMTSMIERIMIPINTEDCWKIIFECVNDCENINPQNLLGVYIIQVKFNIKEFFESNELDKKKLIINTIIDGSNELSKYNLFKLTNIINACQDIIDKNYLNEWIWKKPVKLNKRVAFIRIHHSIENINIFIVFFDNNDNLLKQSLLVSTVPDERVYDKYLGKLEWISSNKVALITKFGEKFIETCN